MLRSYAAVGAIILAGLLAGCSSGSDVSEPEPGKTEPKVVACNSLVGKPLAEAYDEAANVITCTEAGASEPPLATPQQAHCYPNGEVDLQTPLILFDADGGSYFGRTGYELHFEEGAPSLVEMSERAGCGSP